jgi:hypothetical protein
MIDIEVTVTSSRGGSGTPTHLRWAAIIAVVLVACQSASAPVPSRSAGTSPPTAASTASAFELPPFSTWTKFTSADGRYEASFPGQPKYVQQGDLHGDGWVTPACCGFFGVVWADIPGLSASDPKSVYDAPGIVSADMTLVSSRDILVAGHAGREYTMNGIHGIVIERVLIVGDRLFKWNAGGANGAALQAFLDSFQPTIPSP